MWARLGELKDAGAEEQQDGPEAAAQTPRPGRRRPDDRSRRPAAAAEGRTRRSRPSGNCSKSLLADPGLVPKAAAAIAPEELTHTGLRRMLAELYSHPRRRRGRPTSTALRERLLDRPDLFESAQKLQFVGQQMQEREQWLGRLLKRFADMKVEAEERR